MQRLEARTVLSSWGDQEAEKMQDESLKFKTDGIGSRKHADVVCHLELG